MTPFSTMSESRLVTLPEEQVIEYCPNADFERVWRPISLRLPWILVGMCVLLGLLGYLQLLQPLIMTLAHLIIVPLKPFLQAPPSGAAASFIDLLTKLSFWVYGGIALWGLKVSISRAEMPSHLGFTRMALVFIQQQPRGAFWICHRLPWNEVRRVEMERPRGTKSVNDYLIKLTGRAWTHRIKYGDIGSARERELFLRILKERIDPDVFDHAHAEEVFTVLAPPKASESFTELWLKELGAPSQRENLAPLTAGMFLQNEQYQIIRKLGTGGQGIVYLADSRKDSSKPATVALKEFVMPVFPDSRVRKAVANKFQQESEMLGRLSHPQIVKLLDIFIEDHRAYLVLERVDGTTLKKLVQEQGPLPEHLVRDYALQMCNILMYLHSQDPSVIHRDFAPDNLMVDPEKSRLCLIDFSVAQQVEVNITGSVVGKHLYMAPEQFKGQSSKASDIYSLGATLYFLLTGEEPEAISISRPKEKVPALSDSINSIVERCTALKIENRFATVEEIAGELNSPLVAS